MKGVSELPDSYTNIKPAHFTNKCLPPSQVTGACMFLPDREILKPQLALEFEWLQKVSIAEVHDSLNLTWSSHHAEKKRGPPFRTYISALMPLLRDQAHSVATVRHVMDKIRDAVRLLNPGQVPVITADQPIYMLQPSRSSGSDLQIMVKISFSSYHVRRTAHRDDCAAFTRLSAARQWMGRSSEAGIASFGTADSFL